jgi:hypothetical protein
MTYEIKSYQLLSDKEKQQFFDFLKHEANITTDPAYINMWSDNWYTEENTLPYLLEKTKKFHRNRGEMFIVYDNLVPIACSGVCKSNISDNIAVGGVRTWITKQYRNKLIAKELLMPLHKSWAVKRNFKIIAFSFNEYNKKLIGAFKRARFGENKDRVYKRDKHNVFYNGFNEVAFPINLFHTQQWIAYELLDSTFSFKWEDHTYTDNS